MIGAVLNESTTHRTKWSEDVMSERTYVSLMCAAFAASLAVSPGVLAQNSNAAAAEQTKAEKQAAKAEQKQLKPVRVKAPPRPSVKTNIAPGTWKVHPHKGNSPKFRPDREKDWVDPTGGKKPVRVKEE